jgi:hypothetical protein
MDTFENANPWTDCRLSSPDRCLIDPKVSMPRVVVAMVMLLTWWHPTSALACVCAFAGPACEAVWTTDVIFVGRVTALAPNVATHFAVDRNVRGPAETEFDIAAELSNCAYPFMLGERYVIYAHRDRQTGELRTSICSRTAPVDKAAEDLAVFDEMGRPATGSRIYGRITRMEWDYATGRPVDRGGLANLPLTLTSDGSTLRISTNASGSFEFARLKPGVYRLAAELPAVFVPWQPFELTLENDRTCRAVHSVVQPDGRIRGIVTADDGQPLAGVRVEATSAVALAAPRTPRTASAVSDQNGAFGIGPLPPGDFIVGTDLSTQLPPPKLDRRRYYPGVRSLPDARTVHLDAGSHVTLDPFRLPPLPTERTIHVVVLDSDGNLQPGATVTLFGARREEHVTPDGRISFTLPYGSQFDVSARMQVTKGGRYVVAQSGFSEIINRDDGDRTIELRLKVP